MIPPDPNAIDLQWTQRTLDHWCKEYKAVLPTDFIADEIYSTYLREIEALRKRVVELAGVLRRIENEEWDDMDPDDGLHQKSARAAAREALAELDALGKEKP